MTSEIWIQIIFGWPAIITSILLSLAGLWLKKPVLLVVAGVLCLPFTYYLSGFRTPAVVLPLFQFGAAYAISRQKPWVAWLLLLPLVMIALILAYAVLTQ